MQLTNIPKTDIEVSRVAFGCMSTVGSQAYDGLAEQAAIDTIHAALDAGITFFDTAPAYGGGESEAILGRALKGRRSEAVIATKASGKTITRDEIVADCETSLKLLQTDYIDLHQIHWPRRACPLEESLKAMESLIDAGKVRSIGVCNFGPMDLNESLGITGLSTNQVAYSMLARGVEIEVAPICHENEIGLLCYSPLAQGLLTGRYLSPDDFPSGRARTRHFAKTRPEARHDGPGCEAETFEAIVAVKAVSDRLGCSMAHLALAWLLHQPNVTAVLAGASRPQQAKQNAEAGSIQLSEEDLAELDDATRVVKEKLGASLDMWQTESRTR